MFWDSDGCTRGGPPETRPKGTKANYRTLGDHVGMHVGDLGSDGRPGVCVLARDKVCAPLRLLLNYLFRVRALPFACELCRPEDATWMRSPSDV